MKIIIPVDETKKNLCVSFGRTPFFMLYDTEKKTAEYRDNPGANAQGGAGIKAAQAVVDSGAEILITIRCGENAAEVFKAAGVEIYKASGESAEENICKFNEGKLEKLTTFHAGFQGIK